MQNICYSFKRHGREYHMDDMYLGRTRCAVVVWDNLTLKIICQGAMPNRVLVRRESVLKRFYFRSEPFQLCATRVAGLYSKVAMSLIDEEPKYSKTRTKVMCMVANACQVCDIRRINFVDKLGLSE